MAIAARPKENNVVLAEVDYSLIQFNFSIFIDFARQMAFDLFDTDERVSLRVTWGVGKPGKFEQASAA